MTEPPVQPLDQLEQSGYTVLGGVFDSQTLESLTDRLSATLRERSDAAVLRSRGQTYGSRNLLDSFPEVAELPRHSLLREFVTAVLGPQAGIVRVLYFDKPPDRSWSLPWHRDRTIAVKRNDLPHGQFRKPTFKAGVAHVEAPDWLLANMLTLRIHLDPMTDENGPLSVLPGSHHVDNPSDAPPVQLSAAAGDVLAMRPLLSHSSSNSRPGTTLHRRVIHIELAPGAELPDGYEWHSFVPFTPPAEASGGAEA